MVIPPRCEWRLRFIPAGAGNRSAPQPARAMKTVHPRRCGEQAGAGIATAILKRFIPAGAGNSGAGGFRGQRGAVHPRRCGEQAGKPRWTPALTGSSPQVRGTGPGAEVGATPRRFIPAGAGNSSTGGAQRSIMPVHPRRCGEQSKAHRQNRSKSGSSPQVRGTAGPGFAPGSGRRFIPAGAGNRPSPMPRGRWWTVHPRRCGEQGSDRQKRGESPGSSPQVRGTGSSTTGRCTAARFIPAGAGNRHPDRRRQRQGAVHPRRCGEQM